MAEAGQDSEGTHGDLTTRETWFWYSLAAVTYVVASIYEKFLLNWFVGPLWLVAVVWAGPPLADRLRAGRRRTGGRGR